MAMQFDIKHFREKFLTIISGIISKSDWRFVKFFTRSIALVPRGGSVKTCLTIVRHHALVPVRWKASLRDITPPYDMQVSNLGMNVGFGGSLL